MQSLRLCRDRKEINDIFQVRIFLHNRVSSKHTERSSNASDL